MLNKKTQVICLVSFFYSLSLINNCANAQSGLTAISSDVNRTNVETTYHNIPGHSSVSKTKSQLPSIYNRPQFRVKKAVFIFDPRKRQWTAYDANGKLMRSGRASGGRSYCPDLHRGCRTPVGVFRMYAREGANCKSSKFPVGRGGAKMPYCTFFRHGYAIHGSHEVRSYNASHGCIRITPEAAKWLQRSMPLGSKVIVRPY